MSRQLGGPIMAVIVVAVFSLVIAFRHKWLGWIRSLHASTVAAVEMAAIAATATGLLISVYTPAMADFTTSAATDGLVVTVRPSDPPPRWGRGRILDSAQAKICATGGLAIPSVRTSPLRVTMLAVPATNGTRMIALFEMSDGSSLGRLFCSDNVSHAAPASLRIAYEPKAGQHPMSLPISGQFRLGSDISDGTATEDVDDTPLLLEGSIVIEAMSWPLRTGKVRTSAELFIGDVVTFHGVDTNPDIQAAATGVVRGDDSTLQVVVHTRARRAAVARRSVDGTLPLAFAPSVWARAQAMNEWLVLVPAFALLVAGFRSARHYHERHNAIENSQR